MLVPLGANTEKHLQMSDGERHGENVHFVTAGYKQINIRVCNVNVLSLEILMNI